MKHADRTHARFAPSAAQRWVNCPGSVKLSERFPNKSNPAADEGTAAHQIAERCLNKGWNVADHYTIDNTVRVRDGVEIPVTEEMIEGVQIYLDYVREIFDRCDEFSIEARLVMSHIHPELFGTGDAIGYDYMSHAVHVIDFKYGRKPVKAQENYQGICYALGALVAAKDPIETVHIHIVQPRVDPKPQIWTLTTRTLAVLEHDIKAATLLADRPEAPLATGDWCEYCPAAAICPELKARVLDVARDEFGELRDETQMTIAELGSVLAEADKIETWLKNVKSYALSRALDGFTPAGFKIVQRRALRKWTDAKAAAEFLIGQKHLAATEVYEPPRVRSPAQVEKSLSKAERAGLADYVSKVSSGVTLAPLSDRRAAVSPEAGEEFSKVEIEE